MKTSSVLTCKLSNRAREYGNVADMDVPGAFLRRSTKNIIFELLTRPQELSQEVCTLMVKANIFGFVYFCVAVGKACGQEGPGCGLGLGWWACLS